MAGIAAAVPGQRPDMRNVSGHCGNGDEHTQSCKTESRFHVSSSSLLNNRSYPAKNSVKLRQSGLKLPGDL
ncbi:hypothetical protein ACO03_17260 [Pantoea ananatis]|nr:hypothetical protein ACO03_17260 [Pantoea ananatis]